MSEQHARRHVVLRGRVQGVFMRDSLRRQALSLGVRGWVRNRSDGTVEAVVEGPPDALQRVLEWCRHGPPLAVVEEVEVTEEAHRGEAGFRVL